MVRSPLFYGVEETSFAESTVWGADEIQDTLVAGTEADDTICRFSRADTVEGFGGDDILHARESDDILDGEGVTSKRGWDGPTSYGSIRMRSACPISVQLTDTTGWKDCSLRLLSRW